MTEEVGSSWAIVGRRGGSKQRRGSLRIRIGTIKEKWPYVLHLDKSKGGRKRKNGQRSKGEGGGGDRRAVRIIYIHSKARQISQRDETNQETGVGDATG